MSTSRMVTIDGTFENGEHDLVEVSLSADVKEHLSQFPTDPTPVERRGNMEFVAGRYRVRHNALCK